MNFGEICIEELRATRPAEVEEIERAATAHERARIVGHLDLEKRSGARSLALAAIGAVLDGERASADDGMAARVARRLRAER